ncbi:MAG: hypothetical protein ACRDV3_05040 [Acidothermaceae bacterium]
MTAETDGAVRSDSPLRADTTGRAGGDVLADTTELLVKALRALGAAGQPVAASKMAARAWWVLRDTSPREAERVNGVMHYLARLPTK